MLAVGLLTLSLLVAGGSSNRTEDRCSYRNLLRHLKLDVKNAELAEMRPVLNWNHSTKVTVDMFLAGILNVDEKAQTLTTFIIQSVNWENQLLKWNPDDFCGIHSFSVPKEKLWKPDIIVYENILNHDAPNSKFAKVLYFGQCQVTDIYRMTTTCMMDLFKFPFDTQTCYITFRSADLTMDEIDLDVLMSTSVMNALVRELMMEQTGEWQFVSLNMTKHILDGGYYKLDHLIYKITLKRRPLLYSMNLVVPVTFFLILDVASFLISEARGEKLGFKVTVLLSISVLLLILQDILPSAGDRLPVIALLCIAIFLLTGLSLLETMVVSFLVDLDDKVVEDAEVSSGASGAAEDNVGCQQEPGGNPDSCLETPVEENSRWKDSDVKWPSDSTQLKQILEELKAVHQILFSTGRQKVTRKPGRYRRIARYIDNIYFCFYLIISVAFLVFMDIMWFY